MMAIYLGKRGYQVDVFDKLPDIRKESICCSNTESLMSGLRKATELAGRVCTIKGAIPKSAAFYDGIIVKDAPG